jgi:phosphosulfolactate synthase (CoM biosynthesis protein A)
VEKVGLKARPDVRIQFGAGGATRAEVLEADGTRDVAWPTQLALRFLEAGVYLFMIESEGVTENVKTWRTDVSARISEALGLANVMFETADPQVFASLRTNVEVGDVRRARCTRTA